MIKDIQKVSFNCFLIATQKIDLDQWVVENSRDEEVYIVTQCEQWTLTRVAK